MMRGYAETTECRRQFLLGYFGEQLDEPCGNCDSDTCSGTPEERAAAAEARAHTPFPVETPVEHTEWGNGSSCASRTTDSSSSSTTSATRRSASPPSPSTTCCAPRPA